MRTSNILTIGGAFVSILGGIFSLLMVKAFLVDKGQGFVDLSGLTVGLIILAVGLALVAYGRRRSKLETENDARNFEELAMKLAEKNGGQVGLDPICKAASLSKEEATSRMRELTGRGLFDMDFDANGQVVWKISPDAGRAQLADMAGRSR
jgi:hypothetical protein